MILISFGGNIAFEGQGPRQTHVAMLDALARRGVRVVRHSRFFETPAWPDPADPPFNNGVLAVETELSASALMDALLDVEKQFGRQRSVKNAPRTLDLDVLTYHDEVIDSDHLTVPHPRMRERDFVMIPACDVDPSFHVDAAALQNPDIRPQCHPNCFLKPQTLMGIVNVTPDSFSDGGEFIDPQAAIAHGQRLVRDGAGILDIGGESTRPGATPVSPQEEQERILPVIRGLKDCGALLSVDTRHAATMRAALDAGAHIINDVSALTHDPQSLDVVAEAGCPVVLMHMQGTPETMQNAPDYTDAVADVCDYLNARVQACLAAGVMPWNIAVDPGIGFGKDLGHNLALLANLDRLRLVTGCPVLLGASRKSFIEKICHDVAAKDRLPGSLATLLQAAGQGVEGFRVHDVAESVQALSIHNAIGKAA